MATHEATKSLGRLVQAPHLARNGQLVTATYYSKIARAQNHIMAYRRKWIGGLTQRNQGLDAAANQINWRMYFRSGHGADYLQVRLLLMTAATGTTPTVTVTLVNPATLLAITSFTFNLGIVENIDVVPDNFIDATGRLAISDDTAYGLTFTTDDGARIMATTCYEVGVKPVNDATTGAVDPRYSVGDPILDAQALAMAQGQTELLKSNRRHLLSWSSYGISAITNATATYENILDGTSTTVTAATPGWYVNNIYDNTLSRTGVPCVFAVYASATLNGGVVQLTDGTNTLTTGNVTSAGWYTIAGTIPAAASTKYDVHAKGDAGGGAITVSAFALLEYE